MQVYAASWLAKFQMSVANLYRFSIINALYYYTFHVFWRDYLKNNREESVYYNDEYRYTVFWFPDWGLLVVIVVTWNLLKLILFMLKAM